MHSSSRLALAVIAGGIPVLLAGCGNSGSPRARDAQVATGGSVVESGGSSSSGSAGTQATGGNTVEDSGGTRPGTQGSGGWGLGGASTALAGSTTGAAGAGGAAGGTITGGTRVGSGGAVSGGTQSGGRSALGGATIAGGSSAAGSGGTSNRGGSSAGGASLTGGSLSPGGATGSGGTSATGGATGSAGASAAGATGGPIFPPRFVGNIDQMGTIAPDFVTYWDQLTPENAGRWRSVQPSSSDTFNWTALDALYAYAQDNKIPFKEMCFVGGGGQPVFMSGLTTTTGPALVKQWMKAYCDRYPNTRLIEVVKQPLHGVPTWIDSIGGGTDTTWDWVTNCFKWARELCPKAILIIDDYNLVEYASDSQRFIDLVKTARQAGAPIDAIGSETHDANNTPASTLKTLLDKLISDTGLPVYITEYGIGLSDDEQQRAQYAAHFPVFWENPNVKGVTVLGYRYGATFRAYMNLMKNDGSLRPAMTWLMSFLGR